jgi:hypothetical protein
MRDIYTHSIITSDFILVMGDLVSNIRIDEVVRIHKERRKTNKDAIMTMVVKESGVSHRTRCAAVRFHSICLHLLCQPRRCRCRSLHVDHALSLLIIKFLPPGRKATPACLFLTHRLPSAYITSPCSASRAKNTSSCRVKFLQTTPSWKSATISLTA